MKRDGSACIKTSFILVSLFVLSLFLYSSVSCTQSQADFSGVWIRDTIKSDNFYKGIDVVYTITQTPLEFTVKQTFTVKGSEEITTRDYSFTLDGKVKNVEKEYGTEKNTTEWSADKLILTTRSVVTYGSEDVGFTETYALSDKGMVLTAQKSDIIQGGLSVKQVFNKKK